MPERIRISVDAMGGDHAPECVIQGSVEAAIEWDVNILLVGIESRVRSELSKLPESSDRIQVFEAPEVVEMDEQATVAVRKKKDSSMRIAANLAAGGEADAIISAGNTGAFYATVKLVIGTLPGVDRLPLGALFPHPGGRSIVLDVGANVDCKPQHLLEFALMGSVYAEEILNVESPRVGLLSIGEEEAKGNELTREAFRLLKNSDINFVGNIDGHDVYKGKADVVVCDGFTGNVALKVSESLIDIIFHLLEKENTEDKKWKELLGKYFDYSEYGGAPLLGARVPSFVCHGRSGSRAIKNAIRVAKEYCEHDVNGRIHRKLEKAPH